MTAPAIHIFAGPSLPPPVRPDDSCFLWHPPAAAGDLAALLGAPPAHVCLIDGLFESCAAPWHKELLLLLEAGTIVIGAASIGALRAAELDRFGMIGVGAIYRAYRDGRLSGDDEVALVHAPAALDWAPLTVPMVELRATLVAACQAGAIDPAEARALRAIARDIHFEDRDWSTLGKRWGIAAARLAQLRRLHVPLKQHDALMCLAAIVQMRAPALTMVSPPRTCFIDALLAGLPAPGDRARPRHPRRSAARHRRAADGGA